MYSPGDFDWTTRPFTPSSFSARWRPTKARWLKPRSLRPPMSVMRPALNSPPPPPAAAVLVDELFFDDPPQPATRSASRTSASSVFFTPLSEVLDCGTKTLLDPTSLRPRHVTLG